MQTLSPAGYIFLSMLDLSEHKLIHQCCVSARIVLQVSALSAALEDAVGRRRQAERQATVYHAAALQVGICPIAKGCLWPQMQDDALK